MTSSSHAPPQSPAQTQAQRIKLLVSYDGTDYCGWQKQKDHKHGPEKPSLQETLEKALAKILNEPVKVSASGRTDAGVHALGQVAHFDTTRKLPKDICWALRSTLPHSIVVKSAWEAPPEFHATLSATHKTYRYWVWNSQRPTALMDRFTNWVRHPLDLDYLNEQAKYLEKSQDFKSFQSVGTPVLHTVREIYKARWKQRKKHLVEFEITGSGFLKQMVRNIVGTQLDLCHKGQPIEKIEEIIKAQNRQKAGPAAPPQGLFLYHVYYPSDLDIKCRQI
jgi:tRNA pseudouridine38-40 synthase